MTFPNRSPAGEGPRSSSTSLRTVLRDVTWLGASAAAVGGALLVAVPALTLVVMVLLAAAAAALSRVLLWVLEDPAGGEPVAVALRTGGLTLSVGLGVVVLALLLGPVSVLVLAVVFGLAGAWFWLDRAMPRRCG